MIILGTNSIKDTGYNVANSVRLNDGSSDGFSLSGQNGNRKTFTFSCWVKRGVFGENFLFNSRIDASNHFLTRFTGGHQLELLNRTSASNNFILTTNRLFRDVSAWYHIVVAVDTTQSTANDRVKFYVNGVQETSFATQTMGSQNADLSLNISTATHYIGQEYTSGYNFFDGYMAETILIDGSQLAPDQFGEFDEDSGIWKPIDVSGLTFGTNGFYLDFEDSAALGDDVSGNTNNFTVNNLTAIDQTTDTCTNNFMTLNPLITFTSVTDNQVYSEGNTIVIPNSTDNYGTAFGTFGATRGKWYWEAQIIWNGTSNNANFPKQIGFMREDYAFNKSYLGQDDDQTWGVGFADLDTDGWGLDHNGSFGAISGATTLADDKMVMFALDLDNGKFYMGYDGTFFTSGDPTSGATGTGAIATLDATDLSFTIIPALTNATNTTYYKMNFGNPAYAIASSNADGNGFGNFEFAVPSGYFSWCTKNLSEYG